MNNPKKKSQTKKWRLSTHCEGVTLIELLIVLGLIGLVIVWSFPSIRNSMETRGLDNAAKDILTTMQRAKFQAVKTKLDHRMRFEQLEDYWVFYVEREETPDVWTLMPGLSRISIPDKFNVTVNLPSEIATFSPLGFVMDFNSVQNSVTLQSPKLNKYGQPDQRTVSVFAGGSINYSKN
jgi:prepilin-type N-terminal cleavage/methylation domain-containing protein